MSITQINIRVGQALNITCERVISEGLEKIPRSFWERVEDLLPSTYENLERLHKKQVDLLLNPPQKIGVTFEDIKEEVKTLKTLEDVDRFRKVHKDLLISLSKEQKGELKLLTKLGE